MKTYFAYTRVSTVKQGEGVSLEAQQDAIRAYAERNSLTITRWFEEKESASKRGRPVFDSVVQALRAGEADGLIVHKIDRSARNFSDWARIGELVDAGIEFQLAHESLDLRSRGGRLTADIQAVIAADYSRNLREECIKGINGRLKQGLFPFGAPIGYLNNGGGRPKTPDPERAPFVRLAFQLYASQQHSIRSLLKELNRQGFRNGGGKPISKCCLENILSNPFYHGYIRMKRTGQVYQGAHEPLISTALFNRVQDIKANRQVKKRTLHNHPYRGLLRCGFCGRGAYGELQKGRVYYRCQTVGCPSTTIREDSLETAMGLELQHVRLSDEQALRLGRKLKHWADTRVESTRKEAVSLQLGRIDAKLDALTDALIDRVIDKDTYTERKQRLLEEKAALQTAARSFQDRDQIAERVTKFLELVKNLSLSYQIADAAKKRRIAEVAFSNCELRGRNAYFTSADWLFNFDDTLSVLTGPPDQVRTRTFERIETFLKMCGGEDRGRNLAA